tara:strand:- start:2706 stop:3854 length:1149 start_codon:yes stop_codon:yes gene_type:complete
MINRLLNLIKPLTSLKLTITGLSGLFIVILWGTFVQLKLGIFYTQKLYFQSFFIFHTFPNGFKIPIFFGGVVFGGLLTVNLIAVLLIRIKWRLKNSGLILIHLGLLGLLIGSFLTGKLAKESQLIFSEGESKTHSISRQTPELVVSLPHYDIAPTTTESQWIFPFQSLKQGQRLRIPQLFDIRINAFYRNSRLRRNPSINTALNGLARHFDIVPIPIDQSPEGANTVSLVVSIISEGKELGRWGLSQGFDSDQVIMVNGRPLYITLRDQRRYMPYTLSLIDFSHDVYPGTTVPKNFSSLVQLTNPDTGEDREVLIYMNHPLRYEGRTYFQASFGENDTLSVLQVVENPAWLFPYLSTLMITAGLIFQFMMMLIRFIRKKQHD